MDNLLFMGVWFAAAGTGLWLVQTSPLEAWPKRAIQGACVLCFLGSVGRHFGVL
jgi:hypothetical protein